MRSQGKDNLTDGAQVVGSAQGVVIWAQTEPFPLWFYPLWFLSFVCSHVMPPGHNTEQAECSAPHLTPSLLPRKAGGPRHGSILSLWLCLATRGFSLQALFIAWNICKWQVYPSLLTPWTTLWFIHIFHILDSIHEMRFLVFVLGDTLVLVPALSHVSTALAVCSTGSSSDSADMKGRHKQFPLTAPKMFSLSSCLHRAGVMKTSPLLQRAQTKPVGGIRWCLTWAQVFKPS